MSESVVVEPGAGYAVVRLQRERVGNSVDRATGEALLAGLDRLAGDAQLRAVLLASAGNRFFCTGGDLGDYAELDGAEGARAMSLLMQRVVDRLGRLPALSIAAVDGAAVGGGVELAVATDLRVAGADATFCLPQVRLGVVPGWGGAARLAELVGRGRALDLLCTGREIGAEEARALGLVDEVVPTGTAEERARELAAQVGAQPAGAVRGMRAAVAAEVDAEQLAALFARLWVGPDHRAAEQAWRERRARRAGARPAG